MKVLVIGPYPPPARREASRTMAAVREQVTAGHDVTVLSDPGRAAHLRDAISGWRGAVAVVRHARGFASVVVLAGPEAPLRAALGRRGRVLRLIDCLAWGLAMRVLRRVTLLADDPDLVPGSVGGRTGRFLWSGAARIVVGNERSRDRLLAAAGVAAGRIVVAATEGPAGAGWAEGWDGADDRSAAEAAISRRAARDRRDAARGH
ncbi:MAG: hypothetical protein ACKO1Y_05520 [Actinomycetota bacterium]